MHKYRFLTLSVILVLCLVLSRNSNAADEIVLGGKNEQLTQRIEKLENELAELRRLVAEQNQVQVKTSGTKQGPASSQSKSEPSVTSELNEDEIQRIRWLIEQDQKKKSVWSSLDIQLYGYLKADAAYDTARVNPGNYIVYVDSFPNNANDDEFNLTANQSRLGLKIAGPENPKVKTSGLLEFDLYGNYAAENKAKFQMRHAYMKVDWPSDKFSILAGQTSDTMSPLVPETLNYTVLWDAGNIGYRRPQIRLTKGLTIGKDVEMKVEGAVARTIGRSNTLNPASESGEDAGHPTAQGRVSVTLPNAGQKPTVVGFSGHYGKEEYDTTLTGSHKKFDSWSVNLDLTHSFNKWLALKGELFTGQNLDTYFGGIGQGVNTSTYKEIKAKGGWAAATLSPWDKWRFNLGAGIDRVNSDDVSTGSRTLNRSVFGNAIYSINKNTEIGLEVSQWRTDYKNSDDLEDLRVQTSLIYKF